MESNSYFVLLQLRLSILAELDLPTRGWLAGSPEKRGPRLVRHRVTPEGHHSEGLGGYRASVEWQCIGGIMR